MAGSEFSLLRHFLVFALTVFVFFAGISLGALLNKGQVSALEEEISFFRETGEAVQSSSMMADEFEGELGCEILTSEIYRQGETLDRISAHLSEYEKSRKFGESFIVLKEKYISLLARDWLVARKALRQCPGEEKPFETILYFYTNDNCPSCTDQGVILDVMKKKFGDRLLIFSLDTDIKSPEAAALKRAFNITEYPSIVIGKDVFPGFAPKDSVEAALLKGPSLPPA